MGAFDAFLCFFVRVKLFCKKNSKIGLITSITLLLKFFLLQAWIFLIFFNHHNIFEWLQYFQIITILFNYYNPFQSYNIFQSLQSFLIITIPSNHHNIFEWLQYFQIITILFNYYNSFQSYNISQSLQSFSITTIFFNLFTTCDTIFMKVAQSITSII